MGIPLEISPRIWQHKAFRQALLFLVRCFFAYQLPRLALVSFEKYIGGAPGPGGPSLMAGALSYLFTGIVLGVLLVVVGASAQGLLRKKPVWVACLVEAALIAAFSAAAVMIASPIFR